MANDPEDRPLTVLIPGQHWTPDQGLEGRTPQQIRYEDVLRKEGSQHPVDPDPNRILFVGNELHNDAEKSIYRDELRASVLGALGTSFKEGTKLGGIYQEIHEAKAEDPGASLFLEIQTRLEDLLDEPDRFEINGQKLSDEEVGQAIDGLRGARRILIKAAKAAGVFDSLNRQIEELQENPDFERAVRSVEELKDNPRRLQWEETVALNRATPDFRGISTAYINGAVHNMEFHLEKAKADYYGNKANATQDPTEKHIFEQQAEEARNLAKLLDDERFLRNWGKPRANLTDEALLYLKRRDAGYFERVAMQAGAEMVPGTPADIALKQLQELQKLGMLTQQQVEANIAQIELMKKGYDQVVHAIKERAYVSPEQFDSNLPLWFSFKEAGISPEQRQMYQDVTRLFLQLNYLSYIKELTGAKTSQNWVEAQGARISREYFKQAWENMPGFRMAVTTMAKDLFEDSSFFEGKVNYDHVVKEDGKGVLEKIAQGKEFDFQQFVLSEWGYKILSDKRNMEEYRQKLTDAMADRYSEAGLERANAKVNELVGRRDAGEEVADVLAKAQADAEDIQSGLELAMEWARAHRLTDIRDVFQTSVYAGDELFFATGAYDSADIYRYDIERLYKPEGEGKDYSVKLQESHTISDGVRELLHPGLKLKERLAARLKYENRKRKVDELRARVAAGGMSDEELRKAEEKLRLDEEALVGERGFAGPLGDWIRDNFDDTSRRTKSGKTFRQELMEGERDYIPERSFYSLLEMIDTGGQEYEDPQTGERKKRATTSVADVLIDNAYTKKVVDTAQTALLRVEDEYFDFNIQLADLDQSGRRNSGRVLDAIRTGEWWGYYWDVGSAIVSLEKHQTSGDSRDRLSASSFVNNWNKVRADNKLRVIYTDHEYVIGALGMVMSPESGFVNGQTEHILDIDATAYQVLVNEVLSDDRLMLGKDLPTRSELLRTFKTGDVHNIVDVLTDIFTSGNFLSTKEWEKREATKRRRRKLQREEDVAEYEAAQGRRKPLRTNY